MNLATRLKRRLRSLFRRDDVESDLSDEIRLHLDMETEDLVRQGRTREAARREALMRLGGVEQTKEAVRDTRPLQWVGGLGLDIRLGLRTLRKSWGLTLIGGMAMVVVIAVCATIFAIFGAIAGSAPSLPTADRIVTLSLIDRARSRPSTSAEDFERWRTSFRTVEHLTAVQAVERDLITPGGDAVQVSVAKMTASGFQVAGIQPMLGRFLLPEDDRADSPLTAVIGAGLWQSHFARDPSVVGRVIRLGGVEHIVVGVMPTDFGFPVNHQVWIPLRPRSPTEAVRVLGRLAPGVRVESASAELESIGFAAASVKGADRTQLVTRLLPYTSSFALILPGGSIAYRIIPLLFALLLIPPCVNIAVLVYARNVTRGQEFAARFVLGAGRLRIVGQLLIEMLLLTACAGALALVAAQKLLVWARTYAAEDAELRSALPSWMKPELSLETVLYIAVLVVVAAVLAGGYPALHATGRIAQSGFQGLGRSGGPRLSRTWTALVAIQVAVTMAVLPFAARQVWSALKPAISGPGFRADQYLTANVSMDEQRNPERLRTLHVEMIRQLKMERGILSATLSSAVPAVEPASSAEIAIAGQVPFPVRWNAIDDAFFDTFGARLLMGRGFAPADFGAAGFNSGNPAAIVSRAFADRLGVGVNPLGTRVRQAPLDAGPDSKPGPWFEIVGVVDNLSATEPVPTVYHALATGLDRNSLSIVLKTGSSIPEGVAARLQRIATALDVNLRIHQVQRLDDVIVRSHREENILSFALATLVVIVLLFSTAGIYTLAAFAVARQRREIAIRAAIGAPARRLIADILGRALTPIILGAVLGSLIGAFLDVTLDPDGDRFSSAFGLGVSGLLLLATGLAAVVGPARRAIHIDATEMLRES